MLPTPPQLARQFEAGQINRAQFQAAMSLHLGEIVDEMEEVSRNPVAAFVAELRDRHIARKLTRKYSEHELREALVVLSEADNFPPGSQVWNAQHWDIPFHCFLKSSRPPLFRILKFDLRDGLRRITVEYSTRSKPKKTIREEFYLSRNPYGKLEIDNNQRL